MTTSTVHTEDELWDAIDRIYHPERIVAPTVSLRRDALWDATERLHDHLHSRDAIRIANGEDPMEIQRENVLIPNASLAALSFATDEVL